MKVRIEAARYWNHTGTFAEAGQRYTITAVPGGQWFDWWIPSGPDGYRRWFLTPFLPFLRVRKGANGPARFFSLIATIGESTEHAFIIGHHYTFQSPISGEIICFANDVPWAYGNNKGFIEVSIVPDEQTE